MTENEKVALIKETLRNRAFRDIKLVAKIQKGGKIAAFILLSCFVDCLAGFWKGKKGEKGGKQNYLAFLRQFLPQYDAEKIYRDLRCGLVHSYSVPQSYKFVDGQPNAHGAVQSGMKVLNLENFLQDVENAMNTYLMLLDADSRVRRVALERFSQGLLVAWRSELDLKTGRKIAKPIISS